jgi:hypothetical protein
MLSRTGSRSSKETTPFTQRLAEFDATFSAYSSTASFCLAYGLTNILLFTFGASEEYSRWPNDVVLRYGIGSARGFGYCINMNVALLLLVATRTLMTLLRNTPLNAVIPFDKSMPLFHAFLGYTTLIAATLHGACHSVGFARNMWALGGLFGWRFCVCTGFPLLFTLLVIVWFSHKPNRDRNYELFMCSHLAGTSIFCCLLAFHGVYLGKLYTYKWIMGPIVLYLSDRVYRKVVENNGTVFIRENSQSCMDNGITKLELPRVFHFKAGQYAELKIPSMSEHEWHPFTIASAPHEPTMVFYIKTVGEEGNSWTHKLRSRMRESSVLGATMSDFGDLEVRCRGPYGTPAQHHGQYDRVVLISGGVGSTPFLSIAKHVDHVIRGFDLVSLPQKSVTRTIGARARRDNNCALDDETDEMSSGTFSGEEDAESDVIGGVDEIGMSRTVGARDVKQRNKPGAQPAKGANMLKKRPTMKRARSNLSRSGPDSETWLEFFINLSHSAVGNTLLLWLIMLRFGANLMLLGLRDANLKRQGTHVFRSNVATLADLAIGGVVSGTLAWQVFLEIADSSVEIVDVLLLVPLISIQSAVHVLYFLGVLRDQGSFTFNLLVLVWPLGFSCFLLRYFRIVGRRISLVETVSSSHRNLRSLDFVWTVPKASDDDWLCSDLASTIAVTAATSGAGPVRLHRFLTREQPDTEAGEIPSIPGFRNNYGRPCWDTLFKTLANNSPNGVCIGVFVCGPTGLTSAVKEAALRGMIESRRRSIACRGKSDNQGSSSPSTRIDLIANFDESQVSILRDISIVERDEVEDWTRSFNVRFVIREENF